jgi:hypothetical protein
MFALEHRACRGSYPLPGEFEGAAPLDPTNDEQNPPHRSTTPLPDRAISRFWLTRPETITL